MFSKRNNPFLSLIALLLFGVFILSPAPAAAQQTAGAWVNINWLNVRSGPGVEHPVVTALARGTDVMVTHRANPESPWVRVTYPDGNDGWANGWVNGTYLGSNLKPFDFLPLWEAATAGAWVNTSYLNVRSGPGVAHERVAVLRRGTEVMVTHRVVGSTWVRITYPDGNDGWANGWVNGTYLGSNLKPFDFLPVW